ncbi:SET-domain-containing protein [Mycena chlorophos]|uniref:SET-domain-containing protein n=1 Tax=Mycena chlorophos TaxID=658473 RepID=A0A8H6VQH2_MYCCL|nr:SET-domain-containing protein [Mycena chlorophos]
MNLSAVVKRRGLAISPRNFHRIQRCYSSDASFQQSTLTLFENISENSGKLAQITLPDGQACNLRLLRYPWNKTEPTTACLVWGHTKDALDLLAFEPQPIPAPTRPGSYSIGPSTIPGAGLGMFAARDLVLGEAIAVERPITVLAAGLPPEVPADADLQKWPWKALKEMQGRARGAFMEYLTEAQRTAFSALYGRDDSQRFTRNYVEIGRLPGRYGGEHFAVFRDISRVNHSCSPNVELVWTRDTFCASLHARKPIPRGTELFRSYGPNTFQYWTRNERQSTLKSSYSFECTCSSCSLTGDASAESDARRTILYQDFVGGQERIGALPGPQGALTASDDAVRTGMETLLGFHSWVDDHSVPATQFLAPSEEFARIVEEEDCWIGAHSLVHYTRLMLGHATLGNEDQARYWARHAAEQVPGKYFGSQLEDYTYVEEDRPQDFPWWNARGHEKV